MDVSKSNYLRVINAFTQIEGAKAYLFANSEFTGADWDTKISRDIFLGRIDCMVSIQRMLVSMLGSLKMRMIFLII